MLILLEKYLLLEKKCQVEDLILDTYILIYPPSMKELVECRVSMVLLPNYLFLLCLMMISLILFLIWLVISLKARSSLIDNYITNKSILLSMYCLPWVDWWKVPLEMVLPEVIIHLCLISCMLIMLLVRIQLLWRQWLEKRLWIVMISYHWSSWRSLKENWSSRDHMKLGMFSRV